MTTPTTPHGGAGEAGDQLLVEDQRFAIIPEWVIDAELSDAAFRLYSVLLRYGATSGQRMPARRTLAERLHRSVDSVDRAMRELQSHRIVRVEHRRRGREHLTNRYHLRTTNPARDPRALRTDHGAPSVVTSTRSAPAPSGGGRAARVAAEVRPDREQLTETPPPPTPPTRRRTSSPASRQEEERRAVGGEDQRMRQLLQTCGIEDLDDLTARCQASRQAVGMPITRWATPCLLAAIQLATARGWPTTLIQEALLTIAADPSSRSPMRLAEAGPWWDHEPARPDAPDPADLAPLEAELDAVAAHRPALQAQARAELAAEHLPLTRATVTRRAVQILHRTTETTPHDASIRASAQRRRERPGTRGQPTHPRNRRSKICDL
jgi:hypothetical protein